MEGKNQNSVGTEMDFLKSMKRLKVTGVTTFNEDVISHVDEIKAEADTLRDIERCILSALTMKREQYDDEDEVEDDGFGFADKRVVVAHFNFYCPEAIKQPQYLLPSEFAMSVFSLHEGLRGYTLTGLIDPLVMPFGMTSEALENSTSTLLPGIGNGNYVRQTMPEVKVLDADVAIKEIERWLDKFGKFYNGEKWLFVLREHIPTVDRCLKWLQLQRTGGNSDIHGIRIVPLSVLIMVLSKLLAERKENFPPLPNEGAVERILQHPQYNYLIELACKWHADDENKEAVDKCSANIVQRMIYNVMGYFRRCQSMPLLAPYHKPNHVFVDVVDRDIMKKIMETSDKKFPERTGWKNNKNNYGNQDVKKKQAFPGSSVPSTDDDVRTEDSYPSQYPPSEKDLGESEEEFVHYN